MTHPDFELDRLGYAQYLAHTAAAPGSDVALLARVMAEHKGAYDVANTSGICRAVVTGKRMVSATGRDDFPAVGDWVVLSAEPGDPRLIDTILPRFSTLHKQYAGKLQAQLMVANADVAFIVEAMDRDYSPNRFERYVVLAREGGVRPVLVLNKTDLLTPAEVQERMAELHERFEGLDVVAASTVSADGLAALAGSVQSGFTYCFLGSSGVGKSSIINGLLNDATIKTQTIGAKTYRGRHTTTGRALYLTAGGGIIIDNPGSREVGVTDAESGIKEVFDDVEALVTACRFTDCAHITEPGCAVLQALADGRIDAAHYDNYLKLKKEAAHFAAAAEEKRQKDKQFGKFVKTAQTEITKYRPR